MNQFKTKNRLWRRLVVRTSILFKSSHKVRYPKKVTEHERETADIFIKILHDQHSKLYYHFKTKECSLKHDDLALWIFLEPEKVRVVNSTYGFDRRISQEMEYYLEQRFRQENNKRRVVMKEEAVSKVKHSITKTLDKIDFRINKINNKNEQDEN